MTIVPVSVCPPQRLGPAAVAVQVYVPGVVNLRFDVCPPFSDVTLPCKPPAVLAGTTGPAAVLSLKV